MHKARWEISAPDIAKGYKIDMKIPLLIKPATRSKKYYRINIFISA